MKLRTLITLAISSFVSEKNITVPIEPDRPRAAPEDRTTYLPVKVIYEGLADDTNGPYFKGQVLLSPAGPLQTWSISESCVVDVERIIMENARLRRELSARGLGHVL
jgi:hypothetical protein